jgi:hypothetical protein
LTQARVRYLLGFPLRALTAWARRPLGSDRTSRVQREGRLPR